MRGGGGVENNSLETELVLVVFRMFQLLNLPKSVSHKSEKKKMNKLTGKREEKHKLPRGGSTEVM